MKGNPSDLRIVQSERITLNWKTMRHPGLGLGSQDPGGKGKEDYLFIHYYFFLSG